MPERTYQRRRILLTGATGSIGRATALQLCSMGAELLLPVRNPAKGQALRQALLAAHPSAAVTLYPLDMADENAIRGLADLLIREGKPLDALIHNAGVLTTAGQYTPDGIELHRQVNCLSPLLLTHELLPLLKVAASPVVLSVTSLSAFYVSDSPEKDILSPTLLYAHSKRELLRGLQELSHDTTEISFLYAHPGVSATGLFSGETTATAYNSAFLRIALPLMRRIFMSPEQACQTILHALCNGESGQLCEPGGLFQVWGKPRLTPLCRRLKP